MYADSIRLLFFSIIVRFQVCTAIHTWHIWISENAGSEPPRELRDNSNFPQSSNGYPIRADKKAELTWVLLSPSRPCIPGTKMMHVIPLPRARRLPRDAHERARSEPSLALFPTSGFHSAFPPRIMQQKRSESTNERNARVTLTHSHSHTDRLCVK
jgi:hypothetical protein